MFSLLLPTLANVAITLAHQCDRMLTGLLEYQKKQFLENGGVKEQMTRARRAQRSQSSQSTQSTLRGESPVCPLCGKPMVRREQKRGDRAGSEFWGCSDYPRCRGSRTIAQRSQSAQSSQRSLKE